MLSLGMAVDGFIGRELGGRYRVQKLLGRGGMGAVYAAEQLNTGQRVAVKILHPELTTDQAVVRRFRHEADAIGRLRHPNTLRLIDIETLEDGRMCIVTEFLEGVTLDALIRESPALPRLLRLLAQVAEAVSDAHAAGIAHRDLKPSNIMVERFGRREEVKVLDFGIAKLGDQPKLTTTGAIFGTPAYMSPEQAKGEPTEGPSDVYSAGVILYRILAGKLPFGDTSAAALLVKHISEAPPAPSQLRPVDPELEAFTLSMLSKEPAGRPSMAAVASTLERTAQRLDSDPTALADTAPSVGRGRPSSPAKATASAAMSGPEATVSATGDFGPMSDPRARWILVMAALVLLAATGLITRGLVGPGIEAVELRSPPPTTPPPPLQPARETTPPTADEAVPAPAKDEPEAAPAVAPNPTAPRKPRPRPSPRKTRRPPRRAPKEADSLVPPGLEDVDLSGEGG